MGGWVDRCAGHGWGVGVWDGRVRLRGWRRVSSRIYRVVKREREVRSHGVRSKYAGNKTRVHRQTLLEWE